VRAWDGASLTAHHRRAAVRRACSRVALTVLFAVLAGLFVLLVEFLQNPPDVVTAIIGATVFGALIANEVSLRRA
jgi:hypothetical protein